MNKKRAILLLSEIIFAFIVIFSTYDMFFKSSNHVLAYNRISKPLEFEELEPLNLTNIFPIETSEALKSYKKAKFKLYNDNDGVANYKLMYRVYNSTMDIDWFNYYLKFEDEETIGNLGKLEAKETEDYTDIILDEGTIDSKKTVYVEYLMWIDYSIGNEAQNKTLTSNFVLETY